jgi:hypothetical protein
MRMVATGWTPFFGKRQRFLRDFVSILTVSVWNELLTRLCPGQQHAIDPSADISGPARLIA